MQLMKFMEFMNIIGRMLCIHVVQSMKFINPVSLVGVMSLNDCMLLMNAVEVAKLSPQGAHQ